MKFAQWLVTNEQYVNAVVILGIFAGLVFGVDKLAVGSTAVLGVMAGIVAPKARSVIDMAAHDAPMKVFDERRNDRRGATRIEWMLLLVLFAGIALSLAIAYAAVKHYIPHVP